jgi:hypothetical protein
LLADGLFAYLKMETQLKLADLTSGNPRWVRPVPTRFDEFVLGLPVGALLIIGVVLLSSVALESGARNFEEGVWQTQL